MYPDDGYTYVDLIKNADTAMYAAKGLGKNNVSFFSNGTVSGRNG
ncbi:MAG: hypothetical protein JW682_02195 [Campylobacterales bacterium]|nr:hypothetical protein [Campylobacterales bacterium]HEO98016.1 hypothetical protein [Campylobacterota bacterium]